MTSERKIAANRKNAKRSTGPRTVEGKARSSRNALRHGLTIPVEADRNLSGEVDRLSQTLASQNSNALCLNKARNIASSDVEWRRVDLVRNLVLDLITSCFTLDTPTSPAPTESYSHHRRPIERTCLGKRWHKLVSASDSLHEPQAQWRNPDAVRRAVAMLENLERYQRRALSRRNHALLDP